MPITDTGGRPDDELTALRAVVEGTASHTGRAFFAALVRNVARALGTHGAWVTEYQEEARRLETLAFWLDGELLADFELTLPGSPCEVVIHERELVHIPDRLVELFPRDPDVRKVEAVSYLGVPLLDESGRLLGHLAVLDVRPMPRDERAISLFQIFANRASAEIRRLQAEVALRQREAKLALLVESAMDAIVELDGALCITLANSAAEKLFRGSARQLAGESFQRFLQPKGWSRLHKLVGGLDEPGSEPFFWIPGGLEARRLDGTPFPAEATLSRYEVNGSPNFTLILRDIDQRLEAERRIHALSEEARYLREELAGDSAGVLGESSAIRQALRDLSEVAGTCATVLILGETGTGKELFARALHDASPRREGPLIKVNCAAIPGSLIESELFGHERGAFTGATQKREGRFVLAHGGTIFLDEIGELPVELQGKLLRVLQEGELEPVGSSRTVAVDVRVVAATHRDLGEEVRRGRFREDLFYRLNVFPLHLPPLRERNEDVVLIARALIGPIARHLGRPTPTLGPAQEMRLRAYPWPGNVRELRNVLERAIITSRDGTLDLERALPEIAAPAVPRPGIPIDPPPILTARALEELERDNLQRALEATGWQVGGERGAAKLLGVNPSTLKSRIKALGLRRPSVA